MQQGELAYHSLIY